MKKSILTVGMLLLTTFVIAQYRVALHSNGNVTIFGGGNPFTEAYNAAIAGDTIYLPGGNLLFPPTIDKSLTIRGVGHYPVATSATNKTVLSGNLSIGGNADYLHIEGIHLTGILTFVTNQKADFVALKRNRFNSITYSGNGATPCSNNTISECIIDSNIYGSNASYLMISNTIIGGTLDYGTQLGVSNNIFLRTGAYLINNITNSSFTNNIFMFNYGPTYLLNYCSGNTLNNNVFRIAITEETNTLTDNYYSTDIALVFVSTPAAAFSYEQDYSLLPTAQTTYLGAEGTQVGIYGGTFPFKANSVPTNPSITAKTIAPQTDTDGQLPVQVTVKAQSN